MKKHYVPNQGLSLVEVVVSTLIVGVMLVASLDTLGAVFRTQRMNASRLSGPGLAREMMAEILSLPYEDPDFPGGNVGTETGESNANRTDFDDVDDYDNWNPPSPVAKDGTVYAGYTDWDRRTWVGWVSPVAVTNNLPSETGLKLIQVTVSNSGNENVDTTFYALRYKQSSFEELPAADITAITWIGAQLQLGNSTIAHAGTQLLNHVYDTN